MQHIIQVKELCDKDPYELVVCRAVVCGVSAKDSTQHLWFLIHTAEKIDIDGDDFLDRWINAKDEAELREVLLRNERFTNISRSF